MNELARAIVLLVDELVAYSEEGTISDELFALRQVLDERSRAARQYNTTPRGAAALERRRMWLKGPKEVPAGFTFKKGDKDA